MSKTRIAPKFTVGDEVCVANDKETGLVVIEVVDEGKCYGFKYKVRYINPKGPKGEIPDAYGFSERHLIPFGITVEQINDDIKELELEQDKLRRRIAEKQYLKSIFASEKVGRIRPDELKALLVLRAVEGKGSNLEKAKLVMQAINRKL